MRMQLTAILSALVLGVALAPAAALAQNDAVYVGSGAPKRGTVTAMTPNEVKVDVNGVEQSFAVNEIKQIKFGDEPNALDNARNTIGQKNFNAALAELEKNSSLFRIVGAYPKAVC